MENLEKKNHLKDPEYIIAFGVVIISICALVVSIRQTTIMGEQRALMHEQAKAAVWPRLEMGISKTHSRETRAIEDYKISVSNAGVGPAIIKYVRVSYDGKVSDNWWHLFKNFNLPDSVPLFISNSRISQNILRAGEANQILKLGDNLPLAQAFYEHSDKIKFEIYYESIYGDMWKYCAGPEGESTEIIETIPEFNEEEGFKN